MDLPSPISRRRLTVDDHDVDARKIRVLTEPHGLGDGRWRTVDGDMALTPESLFGVRVEFAGASG